MLRGCTDLLHWFSSNKPVLHESHLEEGDKVRLMQGSDGSSFLLASLELQAAMLDLLPVPVCLLLQPLHLLKLALGQLFCLCRSTKQIITGYSLTSQ